MWLWKVCMRELHNMASMVDSKSWIALEHPTLSYTTLHKYLQAWLAEISTAASYVGMVMFDNVWC